MNTHFLSQNSLKSLSLPICISVSSYVKNARSFLRIPRMEGIQAYSLGFFSFQDTHVTRFEQTSFPRVEPCYQCMCILAALLRHGMALGTAAGLGVCATGQCSLPEQLRHSYELPGQPTCRRRDQVLCLEWRKSVGKESSFESEPSKQSFSVNKWNGFVRLLEYSQVQ